MTRILHVTECYAGGVSRAIDTLVRVGDRHEHHLMWAGDESPVPTSKYRTIRALPKGFRARIAALREAVETLKPDLVHAHSSWAGVYSRANRLRVPVVYQPHCYKFDDPASPFAFRFAYRMVEKILSRRTHTVVVLSPHERALAEQLNDRVPQHFLPNIATVSPRSPRKAMYMHGDEVVAMIGRLSPQKDPGYFADVAALVAQTRPQTRFVWIGDGEPRYRSLLEKEGVHVTGWLDEGGIGAQLSQPTVYFHSASYEGFPLSLLDAAAFALPIVARSIPAFDGTGLLQTPDVETSARTLIDVLDHGPSRALAIRGSESIHGVMDEPSQKRSVNKLYGSFPDLTARVKGRSA